MDIETTDGVVSADYKGSTAGNQNENDADKGYLNPAFIHEQTSKIAAVPSENDVTAHSDSAKEKGKEFRYGWSCLTCNMLQIFNKPIVFLICLCVAGFAQGVVITGLAASTVTSIEKQFGLSSSQVGLFFTTYSIAAGVLSLFVGYLCTSHKPRYIAGGILTMAAGTLLICTPKFIADPYRASGSHYDRFCSHGNKTLDVKDQCTISEGWLYQLIFNIGYFIVGAGAQPLFIIGPAHIDEITQRGQGSVYLGIFYSLNIVGRAVGYIVAIPVLRIGVEMEKPQPDWNPSHPDWVGAWWLGFLTGAAIILLPLVPMLGLPRKFPDTDDLRIAKRELEDTVQENKELKLPWSSLKALLKNNPYILVILATVTEIISGAVFFLFLPKLFETQFHFTASDSSLYSGAVIVPGAIVATLLGAYLVKKFLWKCEEILKYGSIATLVAVLCTPIMLLGCDTGNTELPTTVVATNTSCNANCNCAPYYDPICIVDERKVYFSPCDAGCLPGSKLSGNTFQNCSCFSLNTTYAVNGRCTPESCRMLPLFVIGCFILVFFVSINNVPYMEVTMRVVNEGQSSAAMALQELLTSFLGSLPSPVMCGALIDQACRLWKSNGCGGESKNCLEYDIESFRHYMFAFLIASNSLSFVFTLLAWKFYKAPVKRNGCTNYAGEVATCSTL